jgi:hypothetical protein
MLGDEYQPDDESEWDEKLTAKSGDMMVKTSNSVLPNHFWIGVNGKNGSKGS